MEVQFLSAAAMSLTLLALSSPEGAAGGPGGSEALLGARIFATEVHIERWGEPASAGEMALEALGTVTEVVPAPGGQTGTVLVSVGGLWGWGAQEVEVGLDRVHLVERAGGPRRLVVDLSANGVEPIPG